jgi:hypothetical protein
MDVLATNARMNTCIIRALVAKKYPDSWLFFSKSVAVDPVSSVAIS